MNAQSRINIGLAFSIPSLFFSIWYVRDVEFHFRSFRAGGWIPFAYYSIIPWIALFIGELVLRQKRSPYMTGVPLYCIAYIVLFYVFVQATNDWNRMVRVSHSLGMEIKRVITLFALLYQLFACGVVVFLGFIPKKNKVAEQVAASDC